MVMYCLDTNIVLDLFKGDEVVSLKVGNLEKEGEIYLTTITLCEIYKGIYLYSEGVFREKELEDLEHYLENVKIIDLDLESSREFGEMYSYLRKSGVMIPEPDLMIASIVKANGVVLVTRDKRHFKGMKGVKVVEW